MTNFFLIFFSLNQFYAKTFFQWKIFHNFTAVKNEQQHIKPSKEQVFETEFLPQIDSLYNFAFHLTYNEDDANDLVQETYLKAFRFIEKYDKGTNAKAWLFKILKNAFINQYRRKSKQPTKVDYEEIVNYHDEEDTQYSSYLDLREEIFQGMMGDEVTNAINSRLLILKRLFYYVISKDSLTKKSLKSSIFLSVLFALGYIVLEIC